MRGNGKAKYIALTCAVAALAAFTVWMASTPSGGTDASKPAAIPSAPASSTASWIDGISKVKCVAGREAAFERALASFIADSGIAADVAYVYPYEDARQDGRTRIYLAFGGRKWLCDVGQEASGSAFEFSELTWDVANVQAGTGREDPDKPAPEQPAPPQAASGGDPSPAPAGTPIADNAEMQDALGTVGAYLLPGVLDSFCNAKGLSGERVALLGELTRNGNTVAFPAMVGDVRIEIEYVIGTSDFYMNIV